MTNLAGHDLETVIDAFRRVDDDVPTCFIAYTIKGYGLPFAAHKDNHAGLMTPRAGRSRCGSGMNIRGRGGVGAVGGHPTRRMLMWPRRLRARRSISRSAAASRRRALPVPDRIAAPGGARLSTQEGFGRLLGNIAREHPELADRIVTTSPDVTISTSLGIVGEPPRRLRARRRSVQADPEQRIASPQKWSRLPGGQHIELGIAESNLFTLLAALGLSGPLFGVAAPADRHGLRPVHLPRARCAELRVLPGRAVHPRGDAVGPDARARRRRASVDLHAAHRHRASRRSRRSSRLTSTSSPRSCAGASSTCRTTTAVRCTCGCRPGRSRSREREMTSELARGRARGRVLARRRPGPAPSSPSSPAVRSCPRRSRRIARSSKTFPGPDCWW